MDYQKLKSWALLAEIFGGLAVLVTLVVLVLEVQSNTQTLRASTYDSLIADLGNWRIENARNDSLLEIRFIIDTEGREALSPKQALLNVETVVSLFLIYERAYIQWEAGNLNTNGWERFRRAICLRSGDQAFEERYGSPIDFVLTRNFRDYRHNNCDSET